MTKYIRKIMTGVAGLLLLCSMAVQAAEGPVAVEHYTAGDEAVLYIRGVEGEAGAGSYQIGTTPCEITSLTPVKETEEGIKTLILWDNSLSVMNRCGDRVKAILTDVVANRAAGEEFSIATIDREITCLSDYTDDYAALKQVIENVSGENKDAYIIENLYQAIESLNAMEDVSYKRIIVISDGMDATEIGYSKSELDTLISQTPYPVYTIGILDGKHQEELQNMFAISRTTGVEYFYLNEIEDDMTVVQTLSRDYSVWQVKAAIPAEIQDGSVQNSQLVLSVGGSDVTVQSQVTLPFATKTETEEVPEPTEEPSAEEPSPEPDLPVEEPEPEEENAGVDRMVLWLAAGGAAVLLVILLIIVMVTRRKKQKPPAGNDYAKLDSSIRNERRGSGASVPSGTGEGPDRNGAVIGAGALTGQPPAAVPTGQHKTHMLFGNQAPAGSVPGMHRILLVNIRDAVQTYQCSIADKVIVGRNSFFSNLVLEDDAVSEKHCEIELLNGKVYIKDLGSSNGTYVDGIQISANNVEVQSGAILRLGRHEYRLTIE
ncbi:MAG: FHA domain-containing protein [Blautia sp.]|nr:FHA domain-containing protein [Blautia sp.]